MDPLFPSKRYTLLQAHQVATGEMDPMASNLLPHLETRKQHAFHRNNVLIGISQDTDSAQHLSSSPFDQHNLSSRSRGNYTSSQIKVLCSFGGRVMIRPGDGKLRYCGGETRIISLDRNLSYKELLLKMAGIYCAYTILKYQLPGEDLDALVSVSSDEDLQNLFDEYDKLESTGDIKWLRIFLFDDPSQCEILNCFITPGDIENCSPEVKYYIDTLNGNQERMYDVHLEEGMDALSSQNIHKKGTTNSGSLCSENPFVKAASSAPSSPSFSLSQAYQNPWGMMDSPFQAFKEWKNVILPEATRDIFVDTSSTSKCDQNQVCVKGSGLHEYIGFSREEVNFNSNNPEVHMIRQPEHNHGPSIVADAWKDLKHAAGRISPQAQLVNHRFYQLSDDMQYHHPDMHQQMNRVSQPDYEASQIHCHECYVPLQWVPEYDHEVSKLSHVPSSKFQSTTSSYVAPSSPQGVCMRCNHHRQCTWVHQGVNVCTAEHTQNRILSHCGDQPIRSQLPLPSRFHDGKNDLLDDSSWQQKLSLVEGIEEHDHVMKHMPEKKNVQYHHNEYSSKEHIPDYVHSGLCEVPPPQHKSSLDRSPFSDFHAKQIFECTNNMHTNSQDHLKNFTDQNRNVDMDAFEREKPYSPLQDHQRDTKFLQNTRKTISNSWNSMMIINNHGDPLEHSLHESAMVTLNDLSSVERGRSSFASDSASFCSINDVAMVSNTSLLTQDLFGIISSDGNNQNLLERNVDGEFHQKENLPFLHEASHTPLSNAFWLSMQRNDDNGREEIDDVGSYSTVIGPVNFFQDTDDEKDKPLAVPSLAFNIANIGHGCSSVGVSSSGYELNKEWLADSLKGQNLKSLSWQSGTLGWSDNGESLLTLPSPIFDQSPESSINIANLSLKNSEKSPFLDSANCVKEDISCEDEVVNEGISSVMEFLLTGRSDRNISVGKDDAIKKHCNMVVERDVEISPQLLSRRSTKEKGANADVGKDSIRHDQFSGIPCHEGEESKSDSFCFQQLKKKSSVREAELEATARGLQIIKNDDLEVLRELGSGTYGTVFHGKWRGSDIAIKRIKLSCLEGCRPSVQERLVSDFWSEAGTLSQLHHPNIVAFYGVVPDGPDGNLATVTEFMVNGSLKQVLVKKDRIIDRKKRLLIAMDAAFGMEYLHSKNVVHFDLKSENLLVNMRDSHRPVCKVGDFGLSKVKQHTLVSGGIRGTLPWMAPELLSEKHIMVTEKVDVYSFGIVMWELLTGEEPYANMHCGAIIGGIVNNTLRPLIPSWCDPNWRKLMERCWAADPADRPTFADISSELRSMAASMNIK